MSARIRAALPRLRGAVHDLPDANELNTALNDVAVLLRAPAPLAVPDTVRRLVWEAADALGEPIVDVSISCGTFRLETPGHRVDVDTTDARWWVLEVPSLATLHYGGWDPEHPVQKAVNALAIEVESWASSLVAQAVTEGDWGRPA